MILKIIVSLYLVFVLIFSPKIVINMVTQIRDNTIMDLVSKKKTYIWIIIFGTGIPISGLLALGMVINKEWGWIICLLISILITIVAYWNYRKRSKNILHL